MHQKMVQHLLVSEQRNNNNKTVRENLGYFSQIILCIMLPDSNGAVTLAMLTIEHHRTLTTYRRFETGNIKLAFQSAMAIIFIVSVETA